MSSYDERLDRFARERTLIRLAPPVVNRRAALCDACGSHQPRVLYALQDRTSGRHFFVGQSCLQALTDRGAVGRRTARARTEQVYEAELELRCAIEQPQDVLTPAAGPAEAERPTLDAAVPPAGAMLLIAILQQGEWSTLLELVGANRDTCLVIPLGDEVPSLAGAALPLARLQAFADRAGQVHAQ